MATPDLMQPITDAEKEIAGRVELRKNAQADIRMRVAAEQVADELTRIRAELRILRYLFAMKR